MRATRELTAAEYDAWCAKRAYVFDASKITAVDLEILKAVKPGRFVRLRANRCDCPGCAPTTRKFRVVGDFRRFAGLNTPDRKQMGAAQTLAGEP